MNIASRVRGLPDEALRRTLVARPYRLRAHRAGCCSYAAEDDIAEAYEAREYGKAVREIMRLATW